MYTRTLPNRVTRGYTYIARAGSTTQDKSSYGILNMDGSQSGEKVHSYALKIKQQVSASSGYTRSSYRINQLTPGIFFGVTVGLVPSSSDYVVDRFGLVDTFSLAADDSRLQSEMLRRFYQKLGDALRELSLPNAFIELRKSRQLVADVVTRLWGSFVGCQDALESHHRRLRRQRVPWKRAAKDLSNRWLEFQFGIRPLIMDLEGARAAFEGSYDRVVHIRASAFSDSVSSVSHQAVFNTLDIQTKGGIYHHEVRKIVAAVKLQASTPRLWGADLRNIPGVVWEATPWSFLIDYFFDIQGWLTSMCYGSLPMIYCTESQKKIAIRQVKSMAKGSAGPTRVEVNSPGSSTISRVYYNRFSRSALPYYVPSVRLDGAVAGFRPLNILALAGSRIKPW